MDPFKNFKITLDMSRFLNDHRSLSLLYITEITPTIAHLKDKISSIYKIETETFYLICKDQYLPEGEDVRILENGSCIRAIPIPVSNKNVEVNKLPAPVEENNQSFVTKEESKKKKKKKKYQDEGGDEYLYCNGTDPQVHESKRKLSEEIDTVVEENSLRKKQKKDEKERGKKKKKDEKESGCSYSNGALNDVIEENTDVLQLSGKFNDAFQISTISKEVEMSQSNAMETSNCNLSNNTVITPIRNEKIEIISCVSLTPETEQMSTIPAFVPTSHSKDSPSPRSLNTSLSSLNNSRYSVRKLNIDRSGVGALLEELRSKSDLDNTSVTSDSFVDNMSVVSSNLDDSFVNKRRKRVRTRKKKVREVEPVPPVPAPVFKPPNVPACPSIHIRFSGGGGDGAGAGEEEVVNESRLDVMEDEEIAVKGNDELVEGESKTEVEYNNEEYIQSLPRIAASEIEKNDVVAFKLLRMNESYSPEISSFITVQVLSIMTDVDAILCQVLAGLEQIACPVGKFSLPGEDDELQNNNAVKCINRKDMLDLRRYNNVKSNV